ncbi:MAG: hypothetical protein K0B02_00335 [DPANN group archaeon]|nr:hypothetical protein [DPANN group archaeon]
MVSVILLISLLSIVTVFFSLGVISEKFSQNSRRVDKERTLEELLNEFEQISNVCDDLGDIGSKNTIVLTDADLQGLDDVFLSSHKSHVVVSDKKCVDVNDISVLNANLNMVIENPESSCNLVSDNDFIKHIYLMKQNIQNRIEDLSGKDTIKPILERVQDTYINLQDKYLQRIPSRIDEIVSDSSLKSFVSNDYVSKNNLNYVYNHKK